MNGWRRARRPRLATWQILAVATAYPMLRMTVPQWRPCPRLWHGRGIRAPELSPRWTRTARLSLFGWGWHNEAGIQIIRMILASTFDRFPGLQVISGHWGEMAPFYLQRLDDALSRAATGLSRSITETYRAQVHVTPRGMLNLPHFKFIHDVLGVDRILYAVDYPYLTQSRPQAFGDGATANLGRHRPPWLDGRSVRWSRRH